MDILFVIALKASYHILCGIAFGQIIRETLNAILRYVSNPTATNREIRAVVIKHQVAILCLLMTVVYIAGSSYAIDHFPFQATLVGIVFFVLVRRVANVDTRIMYKRKLAKRERKRIRNTLNQEEGA